MFGRATITLGIGPHFWLTLFLAVSEMPQKVSSWSIVKRGRHPHKNHRRTEDDIIDPLQDRLLLTKPTARDLFILYGVPLNDHLLRQTLAQT